MAVIRCTKKLLTKLGVKPEAQPAAPTNRLGDWYANVMNVGSERLVLCVSERTLLPVIIPAREARAGFGESLGRGLRETLEALGVGKAVVDAEVAALATPVFATTASPSLLGSMNDLDFHASDLRAERPGGSLLQLGLTLAEMPSLSLNLIPNDATRKLLGAAPPPAPIARDPSPSMKRQLRALNGLAYERELSAALTDLEADFGRWRSGELDPFSLTDRIHTFHQGASRDLYKRYAMQLSNWVVRDAIERGIISEEEAGHEVLMLLGARRKS